jgi:hypothetical protein
MIYVAGQRCPEKKDQEFFENGMGRIVEEILM